MVVKIGPSQESQNLSLQVLIFEEINFSGHCLQEKKQGSTLLQNLYKISDLHVNNCRVFVTFTFHLNQMLLFTIYKMS